MTERQIEDYELVKDLDSVKNFKVELLEIAGLHSVLEALHLPFGGENKSESKSDYVEYINDEGKLVASYNTTCYPNVKDINLLSTLIKRGDEHAKAIRGLVVYLKITAPRYLWVELDTYKIGTDRMGSNSTMHQECRAMDIVELIKTKESIQEGLMQTRVQMFSYQTLRRLYFQRRNHKLPQWWVLCNLIESLPFAKEWITIEK